MSEPGIDRTLTKIRFGHRAEITTPTGTELEAFYDADLSRFAVVDSSGLQYGEEARQRVEKALRYVGTECSLQPATEQSSGVER